MSAQLCKQSRARNSPKAIERDDGEKPRVGGVAPTALLPSPDMIEPTGSQETQVDVSSPVDDEPLTEVKHAQLIRPLPHVS